MSEKNPKPKTKPYIGITIGDINGIGPEVTIKALNDSRITKFFHSGYIRIRWNHLLLSETSEHTGFQFPPYTRTHPQRNLVWRSPFFSLSCAETEGKRCTARSRNSFCSFLPSSLPISVVSPPPACTSSPFSPHFCSDEKRSL